MVGLALLFVFVAPLLLNGVFFLVSFLRGQDKKLTLGNELVRKELWNLGLSVFLCLIHLIVALIIPNKISYTFLFFVTDIFISLLAREITPILKLNWKKLDRKAVAPIAQASIAFLGFMWEVLFCWTDHIRIIGGMGLGGFALLAYLVGNFSELYRKNKDLTIIRVVFVLFFIAFLFISMEYTREMFNSYPFVDGLEYLDDNPYLYYNQFDAFMHGQLHLVTEPDPALATLQNPYDPYQRVGIPYLWDTVYYNGHYYSYYGVAPIFYVMFPVYILSGCNAVPSGLFCLALATILYAYGIFRLSLVLKEKYAANLPSWFFYTFSFLIFVSTLGYNFLNFRWTDWKYRIPFAYAAVGMTLFLTYFFEGLKREKFKQHLYWGLSALFYVLIMGSRPEVGILAILVVPFLVRYILEGRTELTKGKKRDLFPLIPFAAILLIGGVALASYNYLRFGSFTEFGSNYQLTINDPRTNTLNKEGFFNAFYHYFWQQPVFSQNIQEAGFAGFFAFDKFPFFTTQYVGLDHETHVYISHSVGVLANPMVYLALLLPVGLIANKKYDEWLYLILPPFLLFILCWLMYCLGGVCMRYILYFWPLAGIWVLSVFYSSYSTLAKEKSTRTPLIVVSLVLAFLGMFLAINLGMNPFDGWQIVG